MKTIMWFREDLRLFDNPALHYASQRGAVIPLFIFPEGLGAASYWWLHHSLQSLAHSLAEHQAPLILKTGEPTAVLSSLASSYQCDQVVWNRVYSPQGMAQGQCVKAQLDVSGVKTRSFNGQLLIEPSRIQTKQGTPFKVFTPFWRNCMANLQPPPLLEVPEITAVDDSVSSEPLESWRLLPTDPNWAVGIEQKWCPGEEGAQARWVTFNDGPIDRYKEGRDIPGQINTSELSPHLAFGEISVRQLWFETHDSINAGTVSSENGQKYLAELGWREFSRYLLVHFPHLEEHPFNAKFKRFSWEENRHWLEAWQQGKTGYPIVDAGMRELWHTGFMHNRVRMVVASFLTKHLRTHWREGADWFWDTLVDADIANNTASWQWVAGCGADAAPYFRIFNPVLQGEKFDKKGEYVKRWVPELEKLEPRFIHKPWEAEVATLSKAGITLGKNYPRPIVDHKKARTSALLAYQQIK